jgi:hypothetical protein
VPGGQVWFRLACDDFRLPGLKLIFLVVTRAVSVLGLSDLEPAPLMIVLREYEDFCNSTGRTAPWTRPRHCGRCQIASPDLDHFRVRRHDRAAGVIHEYHLVA